jgi:hypothetical protein
MSVLSARVSPWCSEKTDGEAARPCGISPFSGIPFFIHLGTSRGLNRFAIQMHMPLER